MSAGGALFGVLLVWALLGLVAVAAGAVLAWLAWNHLARSRRAAAQPVVLRSARLVSVEGCTGASVAGKGHCRATFCFFDGDEHSYDVPACLAAVPVGTLGVLATRGRRFDAFTRS